jgi:hypothetical protein
MDCKQQPKILPVSLAPSSEQREADIHFYPDFLEQNS